MAGEGAKGSGGSRHWHDDAREGFRSAFLTRVPSRALPEPEPRRSGGSIWWASWARTVAPWATAFGVFCIAAASVDDTLVVEDGVLPLLAGLIALPVGLVPRHALAGWRLATVLAIVVALVGTPSSAADPGTWPVIQLYVWLALTFIVAVHHDRATVVWVYATTVAALLLGLPDSRALMLAATALVLIGDLVRSRRLASEEAHRQAGLGELERSRRTVLEERTRIARDLHDVVAHHMSMVVVQAESAPYRLSGLPDQARSEFASISASAREALAEMRGLLGVLRNENQPVAIAPQPGLDRLPELIDTAACAGVPVRLTTTGTPLRVGAATGLTAYRIVQEGLANAARHAPGAAVTVRLDHQDGALEVGIVNSPADEPSPAGPPGHGLLGMRERAQAIGGRLDAGPLPDGGFSVLAVLPQRAPDGEQ